MSERRVRELSLHVDRSRPTAIQRQIEDQLRDAIRRGAIAPGSTLPSTRALAEDLTVSRGVVVRAYGQLAAEGYLDLRQGASPSVAGIRVNGATPARRRSPKIRYDLRPHQPELGRFPRRTWLRSLREALVTAADSELGYIESRGLGVLRADVAAYLGRARGVVAHPDQVVITAGSTHSIALISRALSRRGAHSIAFENPSHWVLHDAAEYAGLEPVGVPVDEDGIVVDALAGSDVAAVVTSPAHQFPTGVALAPARRSELVRWAGESGALIVEDDYDAEFRYDRAPSRALHAQEPERIAYVGSTGKTLAPAVRLGWAVLPSELATAVTEEIQHSMLHLSGIDQLAFADFLERGEFDRHLRRMRDVYRRRRDRLVAMLDELLPDFPVRGVAAGLHVVLELPSRELEAEICLQAHGRGLAVQAVSRHTLPGYEGPTGLLIGYGSIVEPAIPAAVEELARAIAAARLVPVRSEAGAVNG